MAQFKVSTQLYVSANSANSGLQDMVNYLKSLNWTVINADVQPKPSGIGNGWGVLAEYQPAQFILDSGSASKSSEDAQSDVKAAILKTNNYSFATNVSTSAQQIVNAAGNIANNAGNNPDLPKKAITAVELVALAVGLLAVAYIVAQFSGFIPKGKK